LHIAGVDIIYINNARSNKHQMLLIQFSQIFVIGLVHDPQL